MYLFSCNPISILFRWAGGTIYWILAFGWLRRSLIEELKSEDNELKHVVIGALIIPALIIYAGIEEYYEGRQ